MFNRTMWIVIAVTFGASRVSTIAPTSARAPLLQSGMPADLQAAITARQEAMDKGDVATWERYTTDDFVSVNTDGTVGHRASGPERERVVANRENNGRSAQRVQESLRVFGDSAAIQVLRVTPPIQNAASNRVTGMWVRQGGVWKVASSHGCTIQP